MRETALAAVASAWVGSTLGALLADAPSSFWLAWWVLGAILVVGVIRHVVHHRRDL